MYNVNSSCTGPHAIKSINMNPKRERILSNEHRNQELQIWIQRKLRADSKWLDIGAFLLLLLLALPVASADLRLNCQAPLESDSCLGSTITVYANNSGIEANRISLNLTLPEGFAYNQGSALITSPSGGSFPQEPAIYGPYLNWTNTAWSLKDGQSLKIQFDLTPLCNAPSGRRIAVNGKSSSGTIETSYSPSILIKPRPVEDNQRAECDRSQQGRPGDLDGKDRQPGDWRCL